MARASGKRVAKPQNPSAGLGRGFGPSFFRQAIGELRRVVWPTREQATRLTILVMVVSAFVGVLLGLLDLGFRQLFRLLV
jgi:preprotein translocase subunit SecE